MMKPRNGLISTIVLIALGVLLTQGYTNCAPAFLSAVSEDSLPVAPLDLGHPKEEKVQAPSQSPPLAHRGYLESMMMEIFVGPNSSANYVAALKANMRRWVTYQGAQLGLGCNAYETASGNDCGGDIANSNLPIVQADTVVREALRIHICEEVMGYDEAIAAAKSKIVDVTAAPTRASIEGAAALFYRGDPPKSTLIDSLVGLDEDLKTAGANDLDRWRMQFMQLCEAPDWQLL